MNILFVIVDTLRRDYIGTYGNEWIQTPNMDRLAAEATIFDFSFTHSYPTIPHRTDVMTGQYGAPFHPWMPLRHERRTFVRELAEAGYVTQLIHDTPHLVNGGHNFDWPFHAWTPVRGAEVDRPWIDGSNEWLSNWKADPLFDLIADYDFIDGQLIKNRTVQTYARANRGREKPEDWNCARLFRTAARWLRDNAERENFLLWVDCFDPHEPWDAPPEFMLKYDERAGYDGTLDPRSFVGRNDERLSEEARANVAAQYAAKVSWVDHNLGRVLDALEETGLAQNTAVLLTADHGTNVGEREKFGKGYPARDQEGRTPFILRVPGAGPTRSDVIVQPQDIYATVLSLAGLDAPEDLDSHDVLAAARRGDGGERDIALAGGRADNWNGDAEKTLFCAFDRRWCLEVAARPEHCKLYELGSTEEVGDEHADVVERLHAAALDGIERRGADPALTKWLRSGGEAPWPTDIQYWDGYPGPAGYQPYFNRIYVEI